MLRAGLHLLPSTPAPLLKCNERLGSHGRSDSAAEAENLSPQLCTDEKLFAPKSAAARLHLVQLLSWHCGLAIRLWSCAALPCLHSVDTAGCRPNRSAILSLFRLAAIGSRAATAQNWHMHGALRQPHAAGCPAPQRETQIASLTMQLQLRPTRCPTSSGSASLFSAAAWGRRRRWQPRQRAQVQCRASGSPEHTFACAKCCWLGHTRARSHAAMECAQECRMECPIDLRQLNNHVLNQWLHYLSLPDMAIDTQWQASASGSDAHLLLGVPPGSPKDVIKRAYRKLVLHTHPDIAHDGSEERFIQVPGSCTLVCELCCQMRRGAAGHIAPPKSVLAHPSERVFQSRSALAAADPGGVRESHQTARAAKGGSQAAGPGLLGLPRLVCSAFRQCILSVPAHAVSALWNCCAYKAI